VCITCDTLAHGSLKARGPLLHRCLRPPLEIQPLLAEYALLLLGEGPEGHLQLAPGELDVELVLPRLYTAGDVEVQPTETDALPAQVGLVIGKVRSLAAEVAKEP
jgi:hypothetical protein